MAETNKPIMTLDSGNAVHKAAIAGIEARDGSERSQTDPRTLVHLRTGVTMISTHPDYTTALQERDRLIADWTT